VSVKGKPLITANQVTLARLVPMPILVWLLYTGGRMHDNRYLWCALIAGTVIGWDWETKKPLQRYHLGDRAILSLAVSPGATDRWVSRNYL